MRSIDRLDTAEIAVFDDKGYGGSAQIRRADGKEEALVFTDILAVLSEDVAVVISDETKRGKKVPRLVRFNDPQSIAHLVTLTNSSITRHLDGVEDLLRIARVNGREFTIDLRLV